LPIKILNLFQLSAQHYTHNSLLVICITRITELAQTSVLSETPPEIPGEPPFLSSSLFFSPLSFFQKGGARPSNGFYYVTASKEHKFKQFDRRPNLSQFSLILLVIIEYLTRSSEAPFLAKYMLSKPVWRLSAPRDLQSWLGSPIARGRHS